MTSNRKMRRQREKKAQKEIKRKMNLFDRLPKECSACLSDFDKKDRAMVESWSVVVREAEKKVRLYCPTCWQAAINVAEQIERLDNQRKEDEQ